MDIINIPEQKYIPGTGAFPLVLHPSSRNPNKSLFQWINANKSSIDTILRLHKVCPHDDYNYFEL